MVFAFFQSTGSRPPNRLSVTSFIAGSFALGLFLLVLALPLRDSAVALVAGIIGWLASGTFGIVALVSGYLSQIKASKGESQGFVMALVGGAFGLTALILLATVCLGTVVSLL